MELKQVIEQYIHYCEYNKQLSHHSISAYKRDLACFENYSKIKHIEKCSKTTLNGYFTYLVQMQFAKKTIKRRFACLKSMFRWLEFEEILTQNPFHKVDIKIKLPQQIPKNISKSDLKKIHQTAISELSSEGVNIQDKSITGKILTARNLNKLTTLTAIELLFCTGIRVAELTNIQLQHINIHEKKIKIIGKGLRERYVFLSDNIICRLIRFYIESREIASPESNFLLVNSQGKKASTHFIRKLIHTVSKAAKISNKITPHMYRHTTASTLLNSGLDIRYVQKILGHQNISTTELYTHVNNKTLQNKVTEINIRNHF